MMAKVIDKFSKEQKLVDEYKKKTPKAIMYISNSYKVLSTINEGTTFIVTF